MGKWLRDMGKLLKRYPNKNINLIYKMNKIKSNKSNIKIKKTKKMKRKRHNKTKKSKSIFGLWT